MFEFLRRSWIILSFRVFGLLSSSLLLYSQRFGRNVLRQVFLVVLRSLHGTSNHALFVIHGVGVVCSNSCWTSESEFLGVINLVFLHRYELLMLCMISFYLSSYYYFFSYRRWFHRLLSEVGDRSRGRQEGSLSIATTPRCRGGTTPFTRLLHFYPWYVPYIAGC